MALPRSEELVPESAVYNLISCPGSQCLSLKGAPGTRSYEKSLCSLCAGIGVVPDNLNPEWGNALRYMRRPFSKREQKRIEHEPGLTRMQATVQVWEARRERALDRLRRGTIENRADIKRRIRERDNDHCQICGIDLSGHERLITLGHRVELSLLGSDSDINLEIECLQCNRVIKPYHSNLESYFAWRREFQNRIVVAPVEDTPEPEAEPEPVREKRGGWFSRLWRGNRGAA